MTREEAKKNLAELYMHLQTSPAISARDYRTAVKLAIEALQERPKGRWIDTYYANSTGNIYNCSNCEVLYNPNKKDVELNRVKEKPNFCPNCGADMRESEQE